MTAAPELPEHFFPTRVRAPVLVLAGKLGVHRVELCEDAAQHALLKATLAWPREGVPDDRGAWLYQVAWRHALDTLRQQRRADSRHERAHALLSSSSDEAHPHFAHEMRDEQLHMLFVRVDPQLNRDAQLLLAARVLCGFSAAELALRLFETEEAVHKRLQRARHCAERHPSCRRPHSKRYSPVYPQYSKSCTCCSTRARARLVPIGRFAASSAKRRCV